MSNASREFRRTDEISMRQFRALCRQADKHRKLRKRFLLNEYSSLHLSYKKSNPKQYMWMLAPHGTIATRPYCKWYGSKVRKDGKFHHGAKC